MVAHESICIPFTVRGCRFEAVGFLKENERSVLDAEMFARTNKDGRVADNEDEKSLSGARHELPASLRGYRLVTNRRDPDRPQGVSYLCWLDGSGWSEGWFYLGNDRNDASFLVVRRCS